MFTFKYVENGDILFMYGDLGFTLCCIFCITMLYILYYNVVYFVLHNSVLIFVLQRCIFYIIVFYILYHSVIISYILVS